MQVMIQRAFLLLGLFLLASTAQAFRPVAAASYAGVADVAIGGYDTVAYFTEEAAVRGSPLLQHEWRGARWYFRTQANLQAFRENPERYAPVYGGHCSFCIAVSGKVETAGDPTIFFIHEDRLYLLQSRDLLDDWEANPQEHIAQANATYARLWEEFQAQQG